MQPSCMLNSHDLLGLNPIQGLLKATCDFWRRQIDEKGLIVNEKTKVKIPKY